ncbi:MAG: lysophospholipid acyltransferase family protein [Phycisphaerales bacterium]|nr:lysophospholipid acyltransferase family protein [Phycisphaerales bacterium]
MLSTFQFRRRNPDCSRTGLLIWWTLVPLLVGTFCRIVWRSRTRGRHHIPRTGAALILANHQSHLDPMLLGIALHDRGPRMMARRTLYTDAPWPLPWMLRKGFRIIAVDQDAADPAAMRAAVKELQEGRLSIVFPEGTRTPDGCLQKFERGAWLLIKRGGAPVLPVGVEGTFDAWPRRSRPRLRGRVMLNIGEAIPCEDLLDLGPDAALAHVRARIDALRLEARAEIRRRSRGRWPVPGPADQPLEGASCTAGM